MDNGTSVTALLNAACHSPVVARAMWDAMQQAAGAGAGTGAGAQAGGGFASSTVPDLEKGQGQGQGQGQSQGQGQGQVQAQPPSAPQQQSWTDWLSIPMLILAVLIVGALVLLILSMNSLSNEQEQIANKLQLLPLREEMQHVILEANRKTVAELTGVVRRAAEQGGTIESLRDRMLEYSQQLYAHSPIVEQRQAAQAVDHGLRTQQLRSGDPRYNTIDTAAMFDDAIHRAAQRTAFELARNNNQLLPTVQPPVM
jgi:hypothetical protein